MFFNIITLPHSLFNLQRIYFSYGIYKELYSKIVYVQSGDNVFICKVSSKPTLSPDICEIDETVSCLNYPELNLVLNKNEINIKEILNIEHLKKVSINIIYKTVYDREKWINCNNTLIKLVKQVLQFLIISNNTLINISEIKEFKKLGISFIEVESVGTSENIVGKVVNSTKVKFNCKSIEHYNAVRAIKSDLNFMNKTYEELNEVFISRSRVKESPSIPFPQVLIVGPAGCGKKTLIKQICINTSSVLKTIECSEVSTPEPGESETLLKRKFQYISLLSKECVVVLMLLRVEAIGCQYGRILLQLNSLLDSIMFNSNIIVILPTNNPNIFHESLRSRFLHQIYIAPPNESERKDILTELCKSINISDYVVLNEVAKFTPGFVLADLGLLVNRLKRYISSETDAVPSLELFKKFASLIEPSALKGELGLVKSTQDVEEIGGLFAIKRSLFQLIQWPLLHSNAFKKLSIKPPSGILLYGPPGCAKTSLIRAVASESNVTFLAVSAADLYSPYVGDAEHTISALFQRARAAAPSLLFIDEIDALVGCRGGRQKGAQERVLSAFLTEMDGVGFKITDGGVNTNDAKVLVVAATNRPNVLDSALLRPGRLDRLVYVPPPDYKDRLDILKVICKKIPLNNCVNLEDIAKSTDLFTGADLANLCREAALEALTIEGIQVNCVKNKHFMNALKTMKPSLTSDVVKWYTEFSFT